MINNLKNKTLFYSLFQGQYILNSDFHFLDIHCLDITENDFITLKSIDKITKEDFLNITLLIEPNSDIVDFKEDFVLTQKIINEFKWFIYESNTPEVVMNYLRSRGFAVSLPGVKLDIFIDYKWVVMD